MGAPNMFIQFDKVKGESSDKEHKEWIEVLSWNHGFSQTASPLKSSASKTVEKASHADFSFTKQMDSATDDLLKLCWNGSTIPKVLVHCLKADGDNKATMYLEIEMNNVIVSSYSIGGGGGSVAMENVSLSYGKVAYKYDPAGKDTGKAAGVQPVIHNLETNEVE